MATIWSARGTGRAADVDLGIRFRHEPGDTIDVDVWNEEDGESGINLDRGEALSLFHALGDWLIATTAPASDTPSEAG